MLGLWFCLEKEIQTDVCDDIISAHIHKVAVGTLYESGDNPDVRRSKVTLDVSSEAMQMMWHYTFQANRQLFGFDLDGNINAQFTQYDSAESGHYDWHIDCFSNNHFAYDRKLSAILALSDPSEYAGGELHVGHDTVLRPEKGTIIVFPSFLYHKVSPVTEGIRHTLVSWADGPKFR